MVIHERTPITSPPFDDTAEFVTTILATPGDQLTACKGWTAHEIVAHLAAGSAEIADLIDAHLAGDPDRPTRLFEEREQPYREMDHAPLLDRMFVEGIRMGQARDALAEAGEDVNFTGRRMQPDELEMHSRSERALHRWDLIGRDDVGWQMLGQPELTAHGVKILNEMPVLNETPANRLRAAGWRDRDVDVVLRSAEDDDLVLSRRGGQTTLVLEPQRERRIDVTLDPAHRLLALWGRREPSAPVQLAAAADREPLGCLFGW